MLSRVKTYFEGSRLVRMSSGTYCLVRDLGLVKGGKGLRHHETLIMFSPRGVWVAACALRTGLSRGGRPFRNPEETTPAWRRDVARAGHRQTSAQADAQPANQG